MMGLFDTTRRECDYVMAKRLFIKDGDNCLRAYLGVDDGGDACLQMFNKDNDEAPRLTLSVPAVGDPAFTLLHRQGKPLLTITLAGDNGAVALFDQSETMRAVLSFNNQGAPVLQLNNRQGKQSVVLAGEDGGASLFLHKDEELRIGLLTGDKTGIIVIDNEGKLVFNAP